MSAQDDTRSLGLGTQDRGRDSTELGSVERGQSPQTKPKSHIASLDGLRGIAVLLVLLFHFSWSFPEQSHVQVILKRYFWSGWIGVDLFFVLSGYLITRGLVKDSAYSTGKRLKLFWARRAFRIFPLYYIVLIVGTIACLALGFREHVPGAGYWLYFQNYTLAFDPMHLRWTAHFWSLAIEEQFYFVWPLVVLLAAANRRPKVALGLFFFCVTLRTGLILGLPKVHALGWDQEQIAKFVYRATPTHMDGLLMGALLAMISEAKDHPWMVSWRKIRKPAFYVGLLMLLGVVVWTKGFGTYDRRAMLIGYPLMAVVFTAAVSLAAEGEFPAAFQNVLTRGIFPACGKVSYGMYIFHWVLVILVADWQEKFTADKPPAVAFGVGAAVILVGMLVTYVIAVLSFRFVETPFLKLKEKFHD